MSTAVSPAQTEPQPPAIERVVVLLSPFFLAAATGLTGFVASNIPAAPQLNAQAVEGVMIAAFLGLSGIVIKWLHGRQIPAIAQLEHQFSISPADMSRMISEVEDFLLTNAEKFRGPAGATPSADQVQALARDVAQSEVRSALTRAVGSSPTT